MAGRRQEAGEADAGPANIVPGPWIGPGSAEQAEESVRPARGNLTGTAQLAPPASDQGKVIDAIILDGLPEAIQPFVPSLSVRRGRDSDRQQFVLRPVDRAAESAGRSIDV